MHNDLAQFIGRACAACMFCQLHASLASARIDTSHIGHVATVHAEHVLPLTMLGAFQFLNNRKVSSKWQLLLPG